MNRKKTSPKQSKFSSVGSQMIWSFQKKKIIMIMLHQSNTNLIHQLNWFHFIVRINRMDCSTNVIDRNGQNGQWAEKGNKFHT